MRGEVGNRSARLTLRIWPSKGRGQIPQSKAVSAAQPLTTPRLVRKSSTDEHRSHTSICYYHHLNKDRLLLPPYIYTGPGPLKYLLLPPPRRGLQLYRSLYNWSPLIFILGLDHLNICYYHHQDATPRGPIRDKFHSCICYYCWFLFLRLIICLNLAGSRPSREVVSGVRLASPRY